MNTDKLTKRLTSLSNAKETSRVRDLYTLLFDDAIWYQAYQNIYSNQGAFTKGVNSDTLDEFNKIRINKIIESLKDKSYNPTPVRRVNIPKPNGKTRPLGIPNGTDKLIQEACRIILEAVYEPKFSDLSHGFRPNRSCHTALREIATWTGTKWFIEFDIKGCFDNINHDTLIAILEERIDNRNFIELITKFLKAGYIENWKYNSTYSGAPQGGIISPILTNIYLDKLDKFIEDKGSNVNCTPNERKYTTEYRKLIADLKNAKKRLPKTLEKIKYIKEYAKNNLKFESDHEIWDTINYAMECNLNNINNGYSSLGNNLKSILSPVSKKYNLDLNELVKISAYTKLRQTKDKYERIIETYPNILRNTKATDTSTGLERLRYVRYADDFVCGYIGTKQGAREMFNSIQEFIEQELKLEISREKSKIVDKSGVIFLGYDISMPKEKSERITMVNGTKRRRLAIKPVFKVPTSKAVTFVKMNKYGSYVDNVSKHRTILINFDIYEIIKQYNAELRGLMNYYRFAVNAKDTIGKVQWIWQYSLLKTIANKHKLSVAQVFKTKLIKVKHNDKGQKQWYYEIGNTGKTIEIFNIRDVKYRNIIELNSNDKCNDNCNIKTINIRSSALRKLMVDECEVCGKSSDDVSIVLHHWNPIRNIPKTDTFWNKVKKMRHRKTIAVCHGCHMRIHHG